MKTSKVLTAFFALLLMSNVSFAQIKPRYEWAKRDNTYVNPVKKAAAKQIQINKQTKKKGNTQREKYEEILKEVSDGSEVVKIGGAGVGLMGVSFEILTTTASAVTGACAVVGVVVGLLGVSYMTKKLYKELAYYTGENRAELYPGIAQALVDGKVFSKYKIILTNSDDPSASHMTVHALLQLKKFLRNPHNMVPWDERGGGYRFYFDFPKDHPDFANRSIYADVDVSLNDIIVRSEGFRPKTKSQKIIIEVQKK